VLNNTKTQSRVAHFTVTVSHCHCHCQWQSLPVTLLVKPIKVLKFSRLFLSRPRPRLYFLSSRRLETKNLVLRTTSLPLPLPSFPPPVPPIPSLPFPSHPFLPLVVGPVKSKEADAIDLDKTRGLMLFTSVWLTDMRPRPIAPTLTLFRQLWYVLLQLACCGLQTCYSCMLRAACCLLLVASCMAVVTGFNAQNDFSFTSLLLLMMMTDTS